MYWKLHMISYVEWVVEFGKLYNKCITYFYTFYNFIKFQKFTIDHLEILYLMTNLIIVFLNPSQDMISLSNCKWSMYRT